jgi:tRNA (guanine10-N2)-dimethyltransferase
MILSHVRKENRFIDYLLYTKSMYVAILGRQPAISIAELEQLYDSDHVRWFSDISALVDIPSLDINYLGGTQKAGRIITELHGDWRRASTEIVDLYTQQWQSHSGKLTLGISAYGFTASPREVQKTGIILKGKLKAHGVSLRLIPNAEAALNTAVSHHNKLGLSDNHIELLVVRAANGRIVVAESVGAQNITALAARDQARPHTDAFVGMLPPKLARIMIHLTGPQSTEDASLLDPFCGTGVVLQEALLDGYSVIGSDLSDKMVDYTQKNLAWLRHNQGHVAAVYQADATDHTWAEATSLKAVVTETYLGQPFSAPPSPEKLQQVRDNCDHIISSFLQNIGPQLTSGTPLCLAVPAWRGNDDSFTHLPLIAHLSALGYTRVKLDHARDEQLLYYRENQVVARELLILRKS